MRHCLKTERDGADVMSDGSLLHRLARQRPAIKRITFITFTQRADNMTDRIPTSMKHARDVDSAALYDTRPKA